MNNVIYTKALAQRFASDYKIPIAVTSRQEIFLKQIKLLEPQFGAYTKFAELSDVIIARFHGNPEAFLSHYYDVRENILQSVCSNPYWIAFDSSTFDMKRFAFERPSDVREGNIYNVGNVGKRYVSIDLRKANFQALRFVDARIFDNAETWEGFLRKFTDLDYIIGSKYTRNVVFGKCNPKRTITVEKFLIDLIRRLFYKQYGTRFSLCVMNNDELVYYLSDADSPHEFAELVKEELDLDVRIEEFVLNAWVLKTDNLHRPVATFFTKEYPDGPVKYVSLPLPFYLMATNLHQGNPITEEMRLFEYDGTIAMLIEPLQVENAV